MPIRCRRPPVPLRRAAACLSVLLALAVPQAGAEPPPLQESLPPVGQRAAWVRAGRPTVVVLPDHLGLDARAAFHAAPLPERGLAVVMLDLPPAPGVGLGDRLRPRPSERPGAAEAMLTLLRAVLEGLATEGLPPGDGPREAIGVLGFGEGGEAALLAARDQGPAGAPRFRAHVALYPGCGSRAARQGGTLTGAPVLVILPHPGGAGEVPGGCPWLPGPPPPPAPDPVLLRAYDGLGHGFDLWPATAWQARDPRFDPLRFDALRAELARRDIAGFLAGALRPEGAVQVSGR